MAERQGSTRWQRQLAHRLRELREAARMTLEEAAEQLMFSPSKLCRIELAGQRIDPHWVRSMADLYQADDDYAYLIELAKLALERPWWHAFDMTNKGYVAMESEACAVREFQISYIPGLLQTEAYARALFADNPNMKPDLVERDVEVRAIRQRRLTAREPLQLDVIIDEGALRRPVGGPEVMRAQLRTVAELATLPNITVRVLPTSLGKHAGFSGAFIILSYPDPEDRDIAYVEHQLGSFHTEKEEAVRACTLTFDRLLERALSTTDSLALIERVADEL